LTPVNKSSDVVGTSVRYNGHKRRKGVKAHAVLSTESLPLAIFTGAGNEHYSRKFKQVVSSIRINTGRGRPSVVITLEELICRDCLRSE
jgi:hypothetical protein